LGATVALPPPTLATESDTGVPAVLAVLPKFTPICGGIEPLVVVGGSTVQVGIGDRLFAVSVRMPPEVEATAGLSGSALITAARPLTTASIEASVPEVL
jgi:hypothetical protein